MTRRFLPLLCVLFACETNLDGGHGALDGGAGNGNGTTGPADDDDATDDLDARLDVGGGVTGLTTEGTGSEGGGQGGSESPGTEDGAGDEAGSTGDAVDVDQVACLPVYVFAALDEHMHELAHTADLFTGHTMATEPAGFILAPGLPTPPAIAIDFADAVTMPCFAEASFPTVCDTGRCLAVHCTGDGASWMTTNWIEPAIPPVTDHWSFDQALVTVAWTEGDLGVEFSIATIAATPDGHDASMLAYGAMNHDGELFVAERFPDLHDDGLVELVYVEDDGQYAGMMRIADVVVADVDSQGHLAPTGECPAPET